MQQRLPSLIDPPIAFAHRGARAHAPENTLESFALALRLGATGLESDVWMTADGVAVLDHDGIVRSGVRRRPISRLQHADLPDHIPTLRELLLQCGTSYHLSLDLKDPSSAGPITDVVREVDPEMLDRIWLCEPDFDRAVALKNDLRVVNILQTTRLSSLKQGAERCAERMASHGIDGINLHRTEWNGGLVALFHRFGLVTLGWDLQFEHDLLTALRMGLDGVYSDHVDVMMDAMAVESG